MMYGQNYKIGDTVSARVHDPDGNEHKGWFKLYKSGWEIV